MDSNSNQPQPKDNPFTTQENPFDSYQKSLEAMAVLYPELQEIGRILYEFLLMSADGKKLWEMLENKYLFSNLVDINTPGAEIRAVYWDGFTSCLKFFKQQAIQHKQRINAV
jgi:hypothetical protein